MRLFTNNGIKFIFMLAIMLYFFLQSNAQSFRTVNFTGNASDFTANERISAANNTDYYITFDANNLYIAAFRTSGTFGATDNLTIYLDTDPNPTPTAGTGTTAGQSYNGVTGTLPFSANYNAHVEQSYQEARSFASFWASTIAGITYFTNTTAREVKIPLANIGNPHAIYMTLWMGFAGGFFSNAPGANISTNNNPTITGYFGGIGLSSANCIPKNITNTPITDVISNATPVAGATYGKVIVNTGTITATNNFAIAAGGSIQVTGSATFDISNQTITLGGSIGTGRGTTINTTGTANLISNTTSNVIFHGEGNIIGNALTFNGNMTINQGFTPLASGNFTIGNGAVLQISNQGFVNTNPPTYHANSTLRYNTGTVYESFTEWTTNASTGAGIAGNVEIENGTTLSFVSNNPALFRYMRGNLIIKAGGTLQLSTTSGGDLKIEGNWINQNTSAGFIPNNRAVFFVGTNAQTITTNNTSGETFAYILINKNTGSVQLMSNIISNVSNVGDILELQNTVGLDINGKTFTIAGNAAGNIKLSGAGTTKTITSSTTGGLVIVTTNKTISNSAAGEILSFDANTILRLNGGNISLNGAAANIGITIHGTFDTSLNTNQIVQTGANTKTFSLASSATMLAQSQINDSFGTGISTNFANNNNFTFVRSIANAISTGTLMPTQIANLTVNHTGTNPTVSLTNPNLTITGTLNLSNGIFDISGKTLTFHSNNTPISKNLATITTNASTNIAFGAIGNTNGNSFIIPNNTFTVAPILSNFSIIRNNDISLGNQGMTVNGILTIGGGSTNGDLNLNGNDIVLIGTLSEDRANNALVKDATATTEANIGGKIVCTGLVVGNSPTNFKGLGLELSASSAYTININRYHYSPEGRGARRLYDVNLTAGTFASTTTTIYYATQELTGLPNGVDITAGSVYMNHYKGSSWINDLTAQSNAADNVTATNNSGYSLLALSPLLIPLPVQLVYFKAQKQTENQVLLTWQTSSEINHWGFEVEKSVDGKNFTRIGNPINPNKQNIQNSQSLKNYSFLDTQFSQTSYYRLKQIDIDKKVSYSTWIVVNGQKNTNYFTIFPNPFSNTIAIQTDLDKNTVVNFYLTDIAGKEFYQTNACVAMIEKDLQKILDTLPNGTYFLRIVEGNNIMVQKIIRY
jgi:hypothetical protein